MDVSRFAAAGVAAEATSTLRIGTLVVNNDPRHPVVVDLAVLPVVDSLVICGVPELFVLGLFACRL